MWGPRVFYKPKTGRHPNGHVFLPLAALIFSQFLINKSKVVLLSQKKLKTSSGMGVGGLLQADGRP